MSNIREYREYTREYTHDYFKLRKKKQDKNIIDKTHIWS